MALMTLRDLIDDVRRRIDDDSQDFITDAEITGYLNGAIYDLSVELQLEEIQAIPVLDVSFIDLPTDFLQLKSVFIDNKLITSGTVEDKGTNNDVFYIWGKKVYFTKNKSGNVELFYSRMPLILANDTDILTDIPENYHHLLPIYAFSRCKEKDEEMGVAMALKDQYNNMKFEMITEMRNKQSLGNIEFVNSSYGGW